ncbi:MAG: YybH family protein, partial [Gemmatimonadaceae bacterium]
ALAVSAAPQSLEAQVLPVPQRRNTGAERRAYLQELRDIADDVLERWRAAWNRDDFDALAELYIDEALFVPGHGEARHGRPFIRQALEASLPAASDLRINTVDFDASDRLIYVSGRYFFMVRPPNAYPYEDSGSWAMVLKRQNDRWYIRSQIMKSDIDIPVATAPASAPETP